MDTYITIRIFCQIGCACFCFFALQGIKNRKNVSLHSGKKLWKRSYYPNLPRSEKIRKSRRSKVIPSALYLQRLYQSPGINLKRTALVYSL